MAKYMLTVACDPSRASLEAIKADLGLSDDEVDASFGSVEIDPEEHRYAILVEESAIGRVGGKAGVKGPFANPPIEPFGPPRD